VKRRAFLTTGTIGGATLAFPAVLPAQGQETIWIGFRSR
jgi:hypothetical protein